MKLTPRLQTLAHMVQRGSLPADIGTDHAYLPVWLIENAYCDRAYASDINQGPLNNARTTVEEADMTSNIDLRLGGGLEPYSKGEATAYLIAGMGGLLISQILEKSLDLALAADYLILQPMQAKHDLRVWLAAHGFEIIEERIAIEGNKYYEIIKVKPGQAYSLSWVEAEVGKNMVKDPAYLAFLNFKVEGHERILQGVKKGGIDDQITRITWELAQLKEVLKCVSTQENL